MVADPPRVVSLAGPPVDVPGDPGVGVAAGPGPGLENMALIPDDVVARSEGSSPEPVGRGFGPGRTASAPMAATDRVRHDSQLFPWPDHLDPHAGHLGGVRVAAVGAAGDPENGFAADPAHLDGIHQLAGRVVGHGEEDDVTCGIGPVQFEEVALPPVVVANGDVGEQLGDLVDEMLVEIRRPGHSRRPHPPCRRKPDRHVLDPADQRDSQGLQQFRLGRQLQVGQASEQLPEQYRQLPAGQVGAEAEMGPGTAKAEMRVGVAAQVERLWIRRTPCGSRLAAP